MKLYRVENLPTERAGTPGQEVYLNEMARAGWRVVSVVAYLQDHVTVYFEREDE